MASAEERFHEEWLGMVQPVDGLVVSIPVLVEAQCLSRQPPEIQRRLAELCLAAEGEVTSIVDMPGFIEQVLGWRVESLFSGDALLAELSLYVPEGNQIIKPSAALRAQGAPADQPPVLLFWDLGADCIGLPLDKPETKTGPWEYPVAAKFDRLLRHTRVPIGVLTNRTQVRLLYAPHGESSGSITFRVADMLEVGGRPILDALIMLLGATRLFVVAPEHQLPAILAESRTRQANVTNELAGQVFDALQILLAGFEAAAERDGRAVLDAAYAREGDHLYGGLLTQLLRLVFVLYAEDRGLLPVESELYAEHLSALGLFEELQSDHGAHPDSMSRRFGAYGRLTALFRAIFLGIEHGDLKMPARRGQLFSPHEYPFLEGWEGEPGSAPVVDPAARAETRLPSIDDETVFRVLEKLLILRRQRLSYRALDVEQIGSVYEALMGYHVVRLEAEAVCLKPSRVWMTAEEVLAEKPATRTKWLQETAGMAKGHADKLNKALVGVKKPAEVRELLGEIGVTGNPRRSTGSLVIQPGPERRRTGSHYTPRSLTAPIVQKALDPLFGAMGHNPPSERILNLKVCDPAMGSGAFLVEACRYLADQVVLAWSREGRHDLLTGTEDATLLARRLVAQRCLYGVDKNAYAVNLAKLSLWLVTLARDLPFTFVDHALRHGDSLVGLSFDQITAFHWKPQKQLELCQSELEATLTEAIHARQRILELAADPSSAAQKEKEWLLRDAEDALERVRLIGDLVVGAFFSAEKDKDRENERDQRLNLVLQWLRTGGPPPGELLDLRASIRQHVPVFHWMAEYPEVFWERRPDPLDGDRVNSAAFIDAFVGNPPFLGGSKVSGELGIVYPDWLATINPNTEGRGDLSAHFFWRAKFLLGRHGAAGLIAPNSISQGDTRLTGLLPIVQQGAVIYNATSTMAWPGIANVSVSIVHFAIGAAAPAETRVLDGVRVAHINSMLAARPEVQDPASLRANTGICYRGMMVNGAGFVLTREERDALLSSRPRNADVIFPYIGGEEVNTSPTQAFHRYVINFGKKDLSDIALWPELRSRIESLVKPGRDAVRDNTGKGGHGKKYWWQFLDRCDPLISALAPLKRCLVSANVTKHLTFSFQTTSMVFTNKLFVFPLESFTAFAVLQSRVHAAWAWRFSSTLRNDLAYTPGTCLETFPFPHPSPHAVIPALEHVGKRLYDARAAYMVNTQQGLTQTYNKLKEPECDDQELIALRVVHVELDRAVLAAYGWMDLVPPPIATPQAPSEKLDLAAFDDSVVDRLFELNAHRIEEERLAGPGLTSPTKRGSKGKASGRGKTPISPSQLTFEPQDD